MIYLFRRIICKYVRSYHISLKRYSKTFVDLPSALYITEDHKGTVFSNADPYIDIGNSFDNLEKLKCEIEKRKMNFDVDFLHKQSFVYMKVLNYIKTTKKTIEGINIELKKVIKQNDSTSEEKELNLNTKLLEETSKLQIAKQDFLHLEKTFVIPFLSLPNSLHKSTTAHDEVLFALFPQPEFTFPPKSHVTIGTDKDELEFKAVSPTAFYLKDDLALLELAVSDFILTRFQDHDFTHFLNVDMVKALVAEGCGIETKGERQPIKVQDRSCFAFNQIPFLFGGSSLPSFVALFCKGLIMFNKDTPIRLVAAGRKYDSRKARVKQKTKDLFSSIQSTCVSAFVVYPSEVVEEAVVHELALLITQIYTELCIHFKLVQYGAPDLRVEESLAVGICMHSSFLDKDIEVGRISLCQDFISKRLQIYQNLGNKSATFAGILYVEILDVSKWIGCMIENTQTEQGDYVIPECLKAFMYFR